MIASTADRVLKNTCESVNKRIQTETEERLACFSHASAKRIEHRLAELDDEWDMERLLETVAPSLTLSGITFGLFVNRKWFVIPFLVQAFFLQHAIQGWCPPIPILRRLGFRTTGEIDAERNALKALRGDYKGVDPESPEAGERAFAAAQR